MLSGYPGDVNNTIAFGDVYALNSDFPMDIGVPDSVDTQTAPNFDTPSTGIQSNNTRNATIDNGSEKPGHWWLMFALVFVGFIALARKFGGSDKYSNIKMSVYNGLFLTFFIVLMLNLMKVIAAKAPPNPVSTLILAA
jgi:hypothetical protein